MTKKIGNLPENLFDDDEMLLDDDFGDIDVLDDGEEGDENDEPEEWTLVRALDKVLREAHRSELKRSFYKVCAEPLEYLRDRLNMTDMQVIVLAMLIDAGKPLSWKMMGSFLGLSRLSMMVYTDDVETLVTRGWATKRATHEVGGMYEGFALEHGVVTAIRNDKVFVPAPISGFTLQEFMDRVSSHIDKNMNDHNAQFRDDEPWLMQMVDANQQLELCKTVKTMGGSIHDKSLFMLIVVDYALWGGTDNEGLMLHTIDGIMPEEYECDFIRRELQDATHPLFDLDLIEHKCVEGLADNTTYVLTQKAKDGLLHDYTLHTQKKNVARRDRSLMTSDKITQKEMFYNDREDKELQQLTELLDNDHLKAIQERLEEQGMRKGFACLFYGAPGTGKTESVLQIARQTGRDLMQVDVSQLRDKYVGESEKQVKEVFTRYESSCKWAEEHHHPLPILFFNEADAIISKRTENVEHSVDKMENSIQNIILQQMEQLNGILIATTNLTSNMDKAFERRFIYKVEFKKPGTDVKIKIWKSMMKNLTDEDAMMLAKEFDFSGGQIENIARKNAVDYVLTGKYPTVEQLSEYCRAEMLDSKKEVRHIAGFAA